MRSKATAGGPSLGELREAEVEELTPVVVSMTLPGLRSRWTIPVPVGRSERIRDLRAELEHLGDRQGPLLGAGERLAGQVLHDEKRLPVLLPTS